MKKIQITKKEYDRLKKIESENMSFFKSFKKSLDEVIDGKTIQV